VILPKTPDEVEIMTEDDKIVGHGDRVYNYYDMVPGTIRIKMHDVEQITNETNIRHDIWFEFVRDGGGTSILNGARICTIEFAKRRGFKGAESGEAS
jgi:hypothetical protein